MYIKDRNTAGTDAKVTN